MVPLQVKILLMVLTTLSISGPALGQEECPAVCRCHGDDNLHVDCSRKAIWKPPPTPAMTLTLDLSRNSLGPIINATFPRMSNLTDLDLSHNGLRRLLGCTFNGMLSLRRVSLRGNRLSSLPDSLFTDANGVEHVDLSHNLLAVLPDDVFRNTPRLKTLDLSHNRAVKLELGRRFQVPRHLEYLDLSHNPFESVEVDSFRMANQWETGIKRTLKLAHCGLASIQAGALTQIPDLNDLDISGNPDIPTQNLTAAIKELERQRFEKLSLAGMNLTDIQPFFTQVTLLSLKFLNVSHNKISAIPSGTFSTIRSLRVLDLSHNKMTSLDSGMGDLINLRVLNMSHNALTSFKGSAVDNLDKVEILDLTDNRLSRVSNVKLRPLIKLQRLKVKTNLLPSVILPRTTNNLVELDYSSNSIRRLTNFRSVPKLEIFDISDNDLEKLGEFLFQEAHYVKVANFSRNSITQLDPRTFLPQSPLVIDLSHNFMTRVQYSNWVATQELYLNHNRLEEVDSQTFHRMTGLRVLDMSENNITHLHDDLLSHTGALERLDLSHNGISQAYFSMLFRNLRDLRSLDLGHNNLSDLNETMLAPLPNLQRLSVRENRLEVIMPRVFRDLKHIKEIDLSNNPFSCVCDMLALRDWLSRTQIPITGLYAQNSSSYTCRGPASRLGQHVMKWEPEQFECDEVMLYMIVFGSIGLTLIVAGIVSTIIHRIYRRYQRKKEEKRKAKLGPALAAADVLKKQQDKKSDHRHLTSEEIAEEITSAIERRELKSMRKAEESKKKNGYVPWPVDKAEREKTKEKEERRGPDVHTDPPARREKPRSRSPERYYDHLTRADGGRMEMVPKDREWRDRGREGHGNYGRTGARRDRDRGGNEYIDIDGGIMRLRSDKPAPPQPPSWRPQERGHYSDQERSYRTEPPRRGERYPRVAYPPGLPPRNRWDTVEVWDRHAPGWVIPGHRRSRSQGQRRERDDQRYLTMPIREQDYYRGKSHERGGRGKPAYYLDHYTNEVRFGVEDLHRYPPEQRRSRRDLYESRSKSYHHLPSEYRVAEDNQQAPPKRMREPRETGYDERHQWADDRRPLIGQKAASQPFLANENASDWL